MKILAALTSLFIGFAPSAMADDQVQNEISYEDALAKCAEFVNDPQIVTIEFKVGCFDESLEWRQTGTAVVQNPNSGMRGHKLLMKEKWATPDFTIPVIKDDSKSSCPILTQFITARETSLVLTCQDFVDNYQDPTALADRCDDALAETTSQTEPTGEQLNVCGGTVIE